MSDTDPVNRTAVAAAHALHVLQTGPLADLRRMDPEAGSAAFWRLAAQHPDSIGTKPLEWADIIRILAILTPKGAPENRLPLHDASRPFGTVLCDGGDPAWSGDRPVLSELRLAQLLAARGPARIDALTRVARMLARSRPAAAGLDVRGIAWAVLDSKGSARIAEHYYRRLDRAEAARTKEATA